RSSSHAFEGLSAFRTDDFTLTGRGEPAHLIGGVVSAHMFSLLGVTPALGRDFTPDEEVPTSTGLPVILNQSLWRERFRSERYIFLARQNFWGQPFTLSAQFFRVIGLLLAAFHFPFQSPSVVFWTPIALDAR